MMEKTPSPIVLIAIKLKFRFSKSINKLLFLLNIASRQRINTNVLYNSNGNVVLPNSSRDSSRSLNRASNVPSLSAAIEHPPSYSDATSGKYLYQPQLRMHGQNNFGITPEEAIITNQLQAQESPPPYESIHSTSTLQQND